MCRTVKLKFEVGTMRFERRTHLIGRGVQKNDFYPEILHSPIKWSTPQLHRGSGMKPPASDS